MPELIFQILVVVIALLGYPAGLIIAHLTKEELKAGRRWFRIIAILSVIGIILSAILARGTALLFLAASFVFIFLLTLASLRKSTKSRVARVNKRKKMKIR